MCVPQDGPVQARQRVGLADFAEELLYAFQMSLAKRGYRGRIIGTPDYCSLGKGSVICFGVRHSPQVELEFRTTTRHAAALYGSG